MTNFLKSELILDAYSRDEAWHCYYDAMAGLATLAVQQHVMTRAAFNEQMLDKRIAKVQVLDEDGVMVGLLTVTNDLDAVPLISPAFFEVHHPVAAASKNIWYVPFVAIPHSDEGAFTALIEHVYALAAPGDGLVVFDACNHNILLGFARAIEAWTIRLSNGKASAFVLDSQRYIGFDVNGAHGKPGRRLPDGIGVRR